MVSSVRTKSGHHPDYFLAALIVILALAGLIILSSASSDLGRIKYNDSYYYLKHQLVNGLLVGLIGGCAAYTINYQRFRKVAFILLLVTLGLIALVFTKLGVTAGGASRWLRLGPVTFQPAEFLKISFVMYLAAWLANKKAHTLGNYTEGLIPFSAVCALVAVLLVLQPATSMVVILIATGLIMYFLSGARLKHILMVVLIGIGVFGLIVYSTPYRRQRIMSFFDRNADAQGSSYQIQQALNAIGSGGLKGVGFGQSASKVSSLPAPTDDSIFAVVGQELGFVGAGSLVVLFGLIVVRMMHIAKRSRDRFAQLMVIGFCCIIALQSFVNMASISGLLPLTGVPLPFVSYGGTALAVFLTMVGAILNVSRYTA